MNIITMAHGSGGSLTGKLVKDIALKYFGHPSLQVLGDQAVVDLPLGHVGFTTDSYVIRPLFFPGGDIGKLSVCGTVNDLAVGGVIPRYITLAAVLEEGFSIDDLERIIASASVAAADAGVDIVAGDTKVVERGRGDGIYLTTSGIGHLPPYRDLGPKLIKPGDYLVVNGYLGDHSVAVLAARGDLGITVSVESDCAPLNSLVEVMLLSGDAGYGTDYELGISGSGVSGLDDLNVRCMRDLTRGGLGTVLCEIASGRPFGLEVDEEVIPVREEVTGACELLGLDVIYMANEGKLAAFVDPDHLDEVLDQMKAHPHGKQSAVIGRVVDDHHGCVVLNTVSGGKRVMAPLTGDQLPRIC